MGSFTLDVEFETAEETLALLGASGCGKTMTLKCIAGIDNPDEGKIVLNNRILFDSNKKINLLPQTRKVGLLFQSYGLFPNMTLEENISIGIPKNYRNKKEIVKEKIKSFSLEGLENNYPHQLSGGQQQRVALARMLVNEPEILMLDEPFSSLDEHLRWQMEQELISILKERSALYVSHNKDEVYRICHRIAILNNGKIEEINQKESLFNKPKTLNAAILTGCKNISKVRKISDKKIHALDWDLVLECSEIVGDNIEYVGFHTHSIKFCSNSKGENSFNLQILNIIENPLSNTIILTNKDTVHSNSFIYMDMSKEEFYNLSANSIKSVCVQLDKENLMLLY